jgi:apolipoprotein N-acyltransferase
VEWLNYAVRARRFITGMQREIGLPIITGSFAYFINDNDPKSYNSAYMVTSRGISRGEEIYNKRMLVPFGERVPYQGLLGFMADWSMGWSDFGMGQGAPLMGGGEDTPGVPPIGMLICYESAFSRLVKPEVVDGAQLLSVITNDAWFGRSTGPYQHLMMSALRAVEFRRPVIRAANSGVSALIDRWGKVHFATRLYTKDAVVARAWPERGFTPYARTGDWLPLAAIVAGAIGLFLFREPKSKPAVSNPQKG